jgi:hypothetical protein
MLAVLASVTATAADLTVGPEDYRVSLRSLQPGDTLRLRAGVYTDGRDRTEVPQPYSLLVGRIILLALSTRVT